MDRHVTRRRFLVATGTAGVAGLAGCASDDGDDRSVDVGDGGTPTPPPEESVIDHNPRGEPAADPEAGPSTGPPPTLESQLYLPHAFDDLHDSAARGAGEENIPSIDDPTFHHPEVLTFPDDMLIFGVVRNGVARAYPQRLLVYHEIVNDVIDGEPVAITYCPLTGTVQGFERGDATFGVTGLLVNNNLVMYDRTTETLWPQIPATGIEGDMAGESLREFPLVWTSLGSWREKHPETMVLTKSTGYVRRYGQDPYGGGYATDPLQPLGFYAVDSILFPGTQMADVDDRLEKKAIVIGLRNEAGALAFSRNGLRETGLLTGRIEDAPFVAVHDPDLDAPYVYRNPDGREFDYADGQVIANDGTRYAPDDLPLDRTMAFDAMWFAWHGYYPDTALVT